jgi:hypothetical protein
MPPAAAFRRLRTTAQTDDGPDTIMPLSADLEKEKTKPVDGAQRAPSASGTDSVIAEVDEQKSGLPFSKLRCIALVLTVTGASFLNVSTTPLFVRSAPDTIFDDTYAQTRPSLSKPSSSPCRR